MVIGLCMHEEKKVLHVFLWIGQLANGGQHVINFLVQGLLFVCTNQRRGVRFSKYYGCDSHYPIYISVLYRRSWRELWGGVGENAAEYNFLNLVNSIERTSMNNTDLRSIYVKLTTCIGLKLSQNVDFISRYVLPYQFWGRCEIGSAQRWSDLDNWNRFSLKSILRVPVVSSLFTLTDVFLFCGDDMRSGSVLIYFFIS